MQPGYARFEQLGALRDAMLDTEPSDGIVVGLFVDRLVFGTAERAIRKRWGLAGSQA